jgi:hypothetical protein
MVCSVATYRKCLFKYKAKTVHILKNVVSHPSPKLRQLLGLNPDISQKYQICRRHKQRTGQQTVARQKNKKFKKKSAHCVAYLENKKAKNV